MAPAWLVTDDNGGWKPRQGRAVDGALSEFQARRRMPDFVRAVEHEPADEQERAALAAAGRGRPFASSPMRGSSMWARAQCEALDAARLPVDAR
jgi:hypothetical protein